MQKEKLVGVVVNVRKNSLKLKSANFSIPEWSLFFILELFSQNPEKILPSSNSGSS